MSIPKLESYELAAVSHAYANKVQWRPEPKRAVLLIHDMQNYFVNFYGAESPLRKQLINNIKALKTLCKELGIPVVYTAQPPQQRQEDRALLTDFWGPGLTANNGDNNVVKELAPEANDICLDKWRYSAFQRSALHHLMHQQQRDQLLVCGVYAHIGILATCLEAFMTDIQAFVVNDAVADFSEQDHRWAADYIARRCGAVTDLNIVRKALVPMPQGLSLAQVKHDVAQILQMNASEFSDDENIVDLALDSIRAMELVERWRAQGAAVQFIDLVERQTLRQWWQLLAEAQQTSGGTHSHTLEAANA